MIIEHILNFMEVKLLFLCFVFCFISKSLHAGGRDLVPVCGPVDENHQSITHLVIVDSTTGGSTQAT